MGDTMEKLIFLDIDGTLTQMLAPPSRRVTRAIREARANGHRAFLCTGRNPPIITPDILEIGFDGMVASAGSYVEVEGRVLYDDVLPEKTVQECLAVFHGVGIYCRLEAREGIYTDAGMEALVRSSGQDPQNSELLRMQAELDSNLPLRPYDEYPRQGAYKISFTAPGPEPIQKAEQILGERFAFVVHNFYPDSSCLNGEIIRRDMGKDHGMELICRYYGQTAADTVAFGDSLNDAPMLQYAGIGVAMGNASPEVKALADRVCESVEQDGIYWEFRRMGFCGETG